jgi:hypothetical protein
MNEQTKTSGERRIEAQERNRLYRIIGELHCGITLQNEVNTVESAMDGSGDLGHVIDTQHKAFTRTFIKGVLYRFAIQDVDTLRKLAKRVIDFGPAVQTLMAEIEYYMEDA